MTRYEALITNGTGHSIKSWFIHRVAVLGMCLLGVTGVVLLVDVVWDGKIDSNLSELAQFVGAISTLFVSAGLPKMIGEIKEMKNDKAGDSSISK